MYGVSKDDWGPRHNPTLGPGRLFWSTFEPWSLAHVLLSTGRSVLPGVTLAKSFAPYSSNDARENWPNIGNRNMMHASALGDFGILQLCRKALVVVTKVIDLLHNRVHQPKVSQQKLTRHAPFQ